MTSAAAPAHPHHDRADLVDREMVASYLETLFAPVAGYESHHFINVRGIGEKGTDREGTFQEDCWAQPGVIMKGVDPDEALTADVHAWSRVWAQHDIASFIVPAVLKEARGSSTSVELFTSLVVDLDTGDTHAKAAYLAEYLGEPSMAVKSGGVTDLGTPKLHLYWVFDTPCGEVGRVVDLRHEIAMKIGGDLQFGRGTPDNPYGRAHQPIRIAGTVHSKGSRPRLVELAKADASCLYDIDILAEAVRRMPPSLWAIEAAAPAKVALGFDSFGPTVKYPPNIAHVLDTPVPEGGEDRTRWSEFNRVAGHYLQQVRTGDKTLEEARNLVHGWALANMQPPWPDTRIDKEFLALTAVEERKGPLPSSIVIRDAATTGGPKRTLKFVRVDELIANPKPTSWLIRGMLETDSLALIFGEPGIGKSFMAIDWAVCVATGTPFAGKNVRQGDVLFIAGEGGNGLARRFTACAKMKEVCLDGAPLYISNMATSMTDDERMREFLSIVNCHIQLYGMPRLVIVDTVARNFGPGDENSTKDMSRFVAASDAIRDLTGACVLLVHHCGHGDKTRARGSIALKGALDWEYGMGKDAGALYFACSKAKDAEPPAPMAFRITQVELDTIDDEGNPETSAVLTPAAYMQPSAQGKTGRGKNQTIALRALDEAIKDSQTELRRIGSDSAPSVSIRDWRDRCAADGLDAKRFREVFHGLIEKGFVAVDVQSQRVTRDDPEFRVI